MAQNTINDVQDILKQRKPEDFIKNKEIDENQLTIDDVLSKDKENK